MSEINRTPPIEVRRALRKEVGFGCPVSNCGSPYLEWHHFDPPWRERKHHEASGMIALCSHHHKKADSGAYSIEQLQRLKRNGIQNYEEVRGNFDWLRNNLLVVVGSVFYFEILTILIFKGKRAIWLTRTDDGYLQLNLKMLTTAREKRLSLEDNCFIVKGEPIDFECPPSGKLIHARYANGDEIKIEFFELLTQDVAQNKYPNANFERWEIEFPVTAVEVLSKVGGTAFGFSPSETKLPGFHIKNSCFKGGPETIAAMMIS